MQDTNQEKVFYQDSNVTVTQSRFIAGSKTYAMRNISSVYVFKIIKNRGLPIIFIIIGLIMLVKAENARAVGAGLLVVGIVWLFSIKDEYSVRISTNAGEANTLISKDQLYIQKIVAALNDAVIHRG